MTIIAVMWGHFIRAWLPHVSIFLRSFLKLFVIVIVINLFLLDRRPRNSLDLGIFVKCYSNVDWGVEVLNFKRSLLTALHSNLIALRNILRLFFNKDRGVNYFSLLRLWFGWRGYGLQWWGLHQYRRGSSLITLPYWDLNTLIGRDNRRWLLHLLRHCWVVLVRGKWLIWMKLLELLVRRNESWWLPRVDRLLMGKINWLTHSYGLGIDVLMMVDLGIEGSFIIICGVIGSWLIWSIYSVIPSLGIRSMQSPVGRIWHQLWPLRLCIFFFVFYIENRLEPCRNRLIIVPISYDWYLAY